jgi:hypothetical protein
VQDASLRELVARVARQIGVDLQRFDGLTEQLAYLRSAMDMKVGATCGGSVSVCRSV